MAVAGHHLPLTGLPEGVAARRVRRLRTSDDGAVVEVLVGGRLRRTDEVELLALESELVDLEFQAGEERWLLGSTRRQWATIQTRYGENSWRRATDLVRAGVVHIRCRVDDQMRLGEPRSWTLTDAWERRRRDQRKQREEERRYWRARALAAADGIADRSPELASALREAPGGSRTTPVLAYAAEDLNEGVAHAGPRAFSQAHFGDTKARDDVAEILTRVGVPESILVELGVRRSAFIGIAGPVLGLIDHKELRLDLLRGPVLVRTDQPKLRLRMKRAAPLIIIENLQAAETLADQLPDAAVVYSAGFPGDGALALMGELAAQADRVMLVPDADLGGVRIAERILTAAPHAELLDIGMLPHPDRERWPPDGDTERGLRAALNGPARALAAGCLHRGYPVEQELATFEAARAALT